MGLFILNEQFCPPHQCPRLRGQGQGCPGHLQEVLSRHFPGRKHVTGPQPTAAPWDRPLATCCWLACHSKLDLAAAQAWTSSTQKASTAAYRCPQITERSLLVKSLGRSLTDGTGAQIRFAAFLPRHGGEVTSVMTCFEGLCSYLQDRRAPVLWNKNTLSRAKEAGRNRRTDDWIGRPCAQRQSPFIPV